MANCQHDNRVRILGGNQSKSVCERDCPLSVHVIKGSWVNTDGQCRRGRQRFVDVHQRREHWKHEYRNVMMTGYAVSINEDGKITEGMMFSYSRVEVT